MLRSAPLVLAAAAVATGCAAVTQPPAVAVTSARVLDRTDAGVQLAVDLELTNPNGFPLPLERVDYRVSLQGAEPFVFHDLPARTIPAEGTQRLTLPAALAAGGGDDATDTPSGAWRVSGTLTYAPDRGLRAFMTETGVPLPVVGFRGEGRLDPAP